MDKEICSIKADAKIINEMARLDDIYPYWYRGKMWMPMEYEEPDLTEESEICLN